MIVVGQAQAAGEQEAGGQEADARELGTDHRLARMLRSAGNAIAAAKMRSQPLKTSAPTTKKTKRSLEQTLPVSTDRAACAAVPAAATGSPHTLHIDAAALATPRVEPGPGLVPPPTEWRADGGAVQNAALHGTGAHVERAPDAGAAEDPALLSVRTGMPRAARHPWASPSAPSPPADAREIHYEVQDGTSEPGAHPVDAAGSEPRTLYHEVLRSTRACEVNAAPSPLGSPRQTWGSGDNEEDRGLNSGATVRAVRVKVRTVRVRARAVRMRA